MAMLVSLIAIQAMAMSHELHHQCHDDADHPDHHCVVTLWLTASIDHNPVDLPALEVPHAGLPDLCVSFTQPLATSHHLRGGVLAQGPPRAP